MELTPAALQQVQPYYRTALSTLWPIMTSRKSVEYLQIKSVPLSRTLEHLISREKLSFPEAEKVVQNLREAGLIKRDRLGFLTPTRLGEEYLNKLFGQEEPDVSRIQPFPGVSAVAEGA